MNWPNQNNPQNFHGGEAAYDPYAAHATAADLAVDDRLAFIRKTYGWLMYALAFGALVATGSFWIFTNNVELLGKIFQPFVWLAVLGGLFLLSAFVVGRLLVNPLTASWGLFLYAGLQGVIFGPLLAMAYIVASPATQVTAEGAIVGGSYQIIWQGLILTGIVFSALSSYVYLTKQDFSFLRGALVVCTAVFFGVIVLYLLGMGLGWTAGGGFWVSMAIAGFGILLASGYILYDTSQILHKFTGAPGEEKVAAFTLLADVCLLLWYILWLLIQLYGRE